MVVKAAIPGKTEHMRVNQNNSLWRMIDGPSNISTEYCIPQPLKSHQMGNTPYHKPMHEIPPPPSPHTTTPPSHPFSSRHHNITHHTPSLPHIHPLNTHIQFSSFITCFITYKHTPTHPYYPFPPIHPPSLSRYFFAGYHTHSNSGDHPTCFESNSFIPFYLISVGCMRLEVNRRKESDGRGRGRARVRVSVWK